MKTIEIISQLFSKSNIKFIGEVFRLQSPEFQDARGIYTNYKGESLTPNDNYMIAGAEMVSTRNNNQEFVITKVESWNIILCKRMLTASETYLESILNDKVLTLPIGNGEATIITSIAGGNRTSESTYVINLELTVRFNQDCLCC